MAAFGFFLVFYGFISLELNSKWPPLEQIVNYIGMILTLIAVLATAISIYFPINLRKPDKISYITAAIIIIGIFAVLFYSWKTHTVLSAHVINGFAIIGLSGALFRLVSR